MLDRGVARMMYSGVVLVFGGRIAERLDGLKRKGAVEPWKRQGWIAKRFTCFAQSMFM